MAGMDSVWGSTHLERAEVWSSMLKESMQDDLFATRYVDWLSEFPDGDTFKISSVGELPIDEMSESVPLPERRPDTGQFTFQITEYEGVKVPYTDKFIEDDFLAPQTIAKTPEKMRRAIDQSVETKVMALQGQQTTGNNNNINGQAHRFVGSGTSNVISVSDFARAKLSLQKANVSMSGLTAIVDATTAYELETQTNLVNVSNNPMWEGIVADGIMDNTGMRFVKNVYGFDVYVSNYLDTIETETLDTVDCAGFGANMFFSAADAEMLPFKGAWRRMPQIKSWRDEDKETEYYQLSARYGLKLYRPENLVVVPTNLSVV